MIKRTLHLVLGLLVAVPLSARSATIRVPADQPTIQAGIDAAAIGDVVLVAPGTYVGPGNKNLSFHGKDLEVRSESGPSATIIDCEGAGRGFNLLPPLSNAALVDGFTITNGDANGGTPEGGGGMLILACSPTISNCIFLRNRAPIANITGGGGGIACHFSSSVITDCTFMENSSGKLGGGLVSQETLLTVVRCVFTGNHCDIDNFGEGGGIFSRYTNVARPASITHSTFVGNHARIGGGMSIVVPGTLIADSNFIDNVASEGGGGGFVYRSTVERCMFSGNSSGGHAGGIDVVAESRVSGCVITENSASQFGGGVYSIGSVIESSVITGNSAHTGGGIYGGGSSAIVSCTLSGNSATISSGLFWATNNLRVEQTIIAFGRIGEAVQCNQYNPVILTCCNVYANEGGDWIGCLEDQLGVDGNVSQDPLFCDVIDDDFALCADSPCTPEQSACGLIGALGVGCGACGTTTVEPTTWGRIKALQRR